LYFPNPNAVCTYKTDAWFFYNHKALEHIAKLKKEQGAKIKEFRLIKDKLKVQKDHAVKLRSRREENARAATALGEKMALFQEQIAAAEEAMRVGQEEIRALRGKVEKRGQIEARREAIVAETARRRAALDSELTDATDELQNLLAQFNDTIDETRGKVKEEERAVHDLQLTIKAYKDKREVAMKQHGKLSAESEAQARRIADRGAFIRELVQRNPDLKPLPQSLAANAALSLGNESDIAEMTRAANEMRERASVRLDALRAAAESLRAKHRGEDDARGAEADAANRELAAAEESVRLRAETRDATRKRGEAIADELAASAVSDATLVDLTGRTDEAHRLYEERRAAGVTVTTADALEACAATLDSLDRQLSKLRGEQDRAAVAGENATKVRLKREELFAKEEACKTLFDSRQGRFADVFGDQPMPAPERVKDALRAVADRRAAAMETQRGEVSNATVAADSAAAARLAAHDALGRLRAEAAEAERKALEDADALALRNDAEEEAPVVADGPFAGFDAAVADVDLRLSNADENVAIYNNLQKVYTSFADRAEDTHQCPVCHHGLDAIDVFKEQMQTKCAALPGLLATTLAEAEVLRGKRARLQRLAPIAARHATLVTRLIPEASTALVSAETAETGAGAAASAATRAFETIAADHASASALVEDADAVTRLALEAEALRAVVMSLDKSLTGNGGGGVGGTQQHVAMTGATQQTMGTQFAGAARSVSAIGADIEQCESKRLATERERDLLHKKNARLEQELLGLERNARDLREEKTRVTAVFEKRTALKRELAEIQNADKSAEAEAARLAAERAPRRAARDSLARERDAARNTSRALEQTSDTLVRDLQRDVDAFESSERPIVEYISGGKVEELAAVVVEYRVLGEKVVTCEETLATHEDKRRRAHDLVQSREKHKRSLQDNLAVRAGQAEEARLVAELDANAAPDPEHFQQLERKQRGKASKRDELRMSCAEMQGRFSNHNESMQECARELNDPSLKDVDKTLSRQVLELKTFEMTSSDLDRYHSALDRALMAFHASKMSDINKVVKELWQRTYRGQDIDFIQIRSDGVPGATGRSNYNYRVCMVVGDAELEMRGRCSAGQKVLACLIIRLALAETFCLNCGILALDEPTTNLDAPNSDALARSLVDIMHTRRDQENFQLIVITHDMHFAQVLGQREHADYYWRITKDEHQHSHIECENIYE
tara:strand:+ start:2354 stop:5959 length:3606 start_codon:yes stop_codon:yes gene_type:complete